MRVVRRGVIGGGATMEGLRCKMAMFYLPALILDAFLSVLELIMSSSEPRLPSRKPGKPTVIILE